MCLTLGLYESVRPGCMCLGRCWRSFVPNCSTLNTVWNIEIIPT